MPESLTHYLERLVPSVDFGNRHRIALMIVDMQYHDASPSHGLTRALGRISPESMAYYNARLESTTVPAISQLLSFFRTEKLSVVHLVLGSRYRDLRDCPPRFRAWTRNLEKAVGILDLWWTGNPNFRILEELAPLEDETVIRKTTNGGFNGSEIDRYLRSADIDTLVITGVVTSACVETTARDAADRGYGCVLVDAATADYDPEMHQATLRAFALNFGTVLGSADEVIEAIRAGSVNEP